WTQPPAIPSTRSTSGRSSLSANVGGRLVATSPVPVVLQPPTLGSFTWRSPRVNMPEPAGSPPEMTVQWRARDDESSVAGYSVQVGSESTVSFEVLAQADRQTAAQQTVTPPNYRDSVYVHIVAWNGAGLAGPVERLGTARPSIPTPPAVPAVAVVPHPDHLRVFLTQLSGDPESG
ncbi:hypothetical protein, partial [Rhodothermus marinus]|uniref:hypothetical protein n=1 Tax=Rhodothermus marinus TaxID=29549 RepID=UPI000B068791